MPIIYRSLTIEDKDQLIELFESNPTVYYKYTDDQFRRNFKELLEEELNNPLCFFPSIFVDDKLCTTLFLKESADAPSWIFTYYMLRGAQTIIWRPEYLDAFVELDKDLTNEMIIKRKLNRMYIVYPYEEKLTIGTIGGPERLYKYLQKLRNYESIYSKIELYTECIVKANTLPKYPYQQRLIGERTWPFDLAIRIGMVKSEI